MKKRRCGFMSAVHALNGYREAQINNKRKELHRSASTSMFSKVRAALADMFYDPFCWEFYVTLRDGGNAAELNRLFEEWGR